MDKITSLPILRVLHINNTQISTLPLHHRACARPALVASTYAQMRDKVKAVQTLHRLSHR